MREVSVAGWCVLVLVLILWALSRSADTAAGPPAHAMEVATLKAEAAGARQEAQNVKAELEKVRGDLKGALKKNEELSEKVAALEKRLAEQAKK
jgi:hypothetical protein